MSARSPSGPASSPGPLEGRWPREAVLRALEAAADRAVLAPSVHNTQPWRLVLHPDRLELWADRSRQLTVVDPLGRELVQSVGAALLNARVALAAAGFAVEVQRLPRPDEPDLLAVLRPVAGSPDTTVAALAAAIPRRHTNRRRFGRTRVPDEVLRTLGQIVAAEGVTLVPVVRDEDLALLAELVREADRRQNADPAYRAELLRWTTRGSTEGDGVPAAAVPPAGSRGPDRWPVRDFDTTGTAALLPDSGTEGEQTIVLLATPADDRAAWLRAGEAVQRLLLDLTARGWVASPVSQPVEVPLTRTKLRSAFAWNQHPQNLLRIGLAERTEATPRRPRGDLVQYGTGAPEAPTSREPAGPRRRPTPPPRPRPDGRGGTTWG